VVILLLFTHNSITDADSGDREDRYYPLIIGCLFPKKLKILVTENRLPLIYLAQKYYFISGRKIFIKSTLLAHKPI